MPELHIITGSNGAGKSSVGPDHLPKHIRETCVVFDGDKLTIEKKRELLNKKFSRKDAQRMADEWLGPYFLKQVENALKKSENFAYEGHFRQEGAWSIPKKFQEKGYRIHMIFFGLVNIERSAMRVFERACNGGHNVSAAEIELNYQGNLIQLDRHFKMFDELKIIDSSESIPDLITHGRRTNSISSTIP